MDIPCISWIYSPISVNLDIPRPPPLDFFFLALIFLHTSIHSPPYFHPLIPHSAHVLTHFLSFQSWGRPTILSCDELRQWHIIHTPKQSYLTAHSYANEEPRSVLKIYYMLCKLKDVNATFAHKSKETHLKWFVCLRKYWPSDKSFWSTHVIDRHLVKPICFFSAVLLSECEMPKWDVWQGYHHAAGKNTIL